MKLDYYTPQKLSLSDPQVRRPLVRAFLALTIFYIAIEIIPMKFYLWIGRF